MVAGDIGGYDAADDLGDGVFQKRNARLGPAVVDAELGFGLGRLLGLGKIDGKSLLMLFQDTDAECAVLLQQGEEVAPPIHADKNKEWVERDGGKGVRGHAIRLARRARDGNDGDAGSEMGAGLAEVRYGDRS